MTFLVWLNQSGFAKWVSESNSLWAYPGILFAHTLGMSIVVGLNSVVDLRILGVGRRVPLAPMEGLFPLMWLGFCINAASGSALFVANAVEIAGNRAFQIKMVFIGLAMMNMWLLRRRAFHHPGMETGPVLMNAKILAGTSLAFWTVAITAGRLTAYVGENLVVP